MNNARFLLSLRGNERSTVPDGRFAGPWAGEAAPGQKTRIILTHDKENFHATGSRAAGQTRNGNLCTLSG